MQAFYAPGARVVIRDREWFVRRADPSDDGGYILTVDGLSELVCGKSARFLTQLEEKAGAIRVLDPAETHFEKDLNPRFKKSRLFIETRLCQITCQTAPVQPPPNTAPPSSNPIGKKTTGRRGNYFCIKARDTGACNGLLN